MMLDSAVDNLVPDNGAGFRIYLFYFAMMHQNISSQNGMFSLFLGSLLFTFSPQGVSLC